MKQIRLTETAERRLVEIAEFTVEKFGEVQAVRYRDQLIERLGELAGGEPPYGRCCELLGFKGSKLLYYREGMHYLIYEEQPDLLTIYDFVHVARNLPELLAQIEAGELL